MIFDTELVHGIFLKRYKRFLTDIRLDDGTVVVAHTNNSGSMKTCTEEGAEVYLKYHDDAKRKTKYSWEMIKINNSWIGVNTLVPNKLVFDTIVNKKIKELAMYTEVKREVKFEDSRFDVWAKNHHEECFVEVKNVTYKQGDFALFPDAVSLRGQKHLHALVRAKKAGYRAVMFYVIQRSDISKFGMAKSIDPNYAKALYEAEQEGVEVFAYVADVNNKYIELSRQVEFVRDNACK